ncbi:hypothetical protein AMAG_07103 [Allomyces macrogynus ATCC 38327]|uniref:Uncharacterized protein n=1 Tax=Allomyces macrogynus (strain ATCC 38327) TaxID=578462 RepID=A0A0L0SH46_ALLM3|nr:hypothetical protein AMAG_07103 [Allomyces macrogynus ATCC 38327]|eukprot:KNE61826.1 hypothetical protein AMAG_07103 [Allomyces macrogynus ATCC 38327]
MNAYGGAPPLNGPAPTMPTSAPIPNSAPMPATELVPMHGAMPTAPTRHDAGFTINIQLRYLPTTNTGERARIEMHDPMVTVATDPPGTSLSVSQALVRTDVAWPSFVQVLLQQLVQLPASVEQSVRMAGGMYLHTVPPLPSPVAPALAPQRQPASAALNALGALATNPIMQSLAQSNPVLTQLMLAQVARSSVSSGSLPAHSVPGCGDRRRGRSRSRSPSHGRGRRRSNTRSRSPLRRSHSGRRSPSPPARMRRGSPPRRGSPLPLLGRGSFHGRSGSRTRSRSPFDRRGPASSSGSNSPGVLEFKVVNLPSWKASFNGRIEPFFEHTGARARFEPTGLGTGIVWLEFDPAALDVETVVRRTLARSWTVFGGRPLIIEPVDPKWRGLLRETPKPEIYVVINTPGQHEAPLKDVTRHFDVDKVWPYLDRAPAYIPGTTLSYTFMTVENPPRPNLLMDRDGIMVLGHKVRVKRIEDPVSFFRTPYQLHDMCMQMARADPELNKLVEHAVKSGHFGDGGPGPRGRS